MQRKESRSLTRSASFLGAAMTWALMAIAPTSAVAFDERDESVVIANEADPSADEPAAVEGEAVGEPAEDAIVDGEPSAGQAPPPPPEEAPGEPAADEPLDGSDAAPKD